MVAKQSEWRRIWSEFTVVEIWTVGGKRYDVIDAVEDLPSSQDLLVLFCRLSLFWWIKPMIFRF